jgi:SAM-dependent methyltransferase
MNLQLIHKSAEIHKQNLEHCSNFKQNDLKLSDGGKSFWIKRDVARLPATYYFNKYVKDYNLNSKKLLSFGGSDDVEAKILPINYWFNCDYWANHHYDVEDLSQSNLDIDFDFCLINQAFEHLTDIESAIKNIHNHLAKDGFLYCNFPVLNIPHAEPYLFFTGITVQYIIYLCLKHNFQIKISGQWGNQEYIEYIYKNLNWPDYTQINLDCDIKKPCIGWVLAQKI